MPIDIFVLALFRLFSHGCYAIQLETTRYHTHYCSFCSKFVFSERESHNWRAVGETQTTSGVVILTIPPPSFGAGFSLSPILLPQITTMRTKNYFHQNNALTSLDCLVRDQTLLPAGVKSVEITITTHACVDFRFQFPWITSGVQWLFTWHDHLEINFRFFRPGYFVRF